LGIDFGALIPNGTCGNNGTFGIEGFSGPPLAYSFSLQIQSLGGTIDYIAFDEPLHFGHTYTGPLECLMSIDEVAIMTAQTVMTFESVFPNIVCGDIEPVWYIDPNWASDMIQWIQTYPLYTGKPLAFLHVDTDFRVLNITIPPLISIVNNASVHFGAIFNGLNWPSNTSGSWISQAELNIQSYFNVYKFPIPDQIIVQSWNVYPVQVAPETSSDALTYLINFIYPYLEPHVTSGSTTSAMSPVTTGSTTSAQSPNVTTGSSTAVEGGSSTSTGNFNGNLKGVQFIIVGIVILAVFV